MSDAAVFSKIHQFNFVVSNTTPRLWCGIPARNGVTIIAFHHRFAVELVGRRRSTAQGKLRSMPQEAVPKGEIARRLEISSQTVSRYVGKLGRIAR